MDRIERFYEENKDKVVIRKNGTKPVDVLQNLVDVKEHPLTVLARIRIKLLEENARIHFQERDTFPKDKMARLHIYEILENEKSAQYYAETEHQRTHASVPVFENQVVYLIAEENIGIMESNSVLLTRDFRIAYGITEKDLCERNNEFADYVTVFDEEMWNPPEDIEGSGFDVIVDVMDMEEY